MDMVLTMIRIVIFLAPAAIFFGGFWIGLIMMFDDPYNNKGEIVFFGGLIVGGILLLIQRAVMG